MGYTVSTIGFEGPFELLLRLVTRQKVDIGAVSVSAIADQYLAELDRMSEVDLEVASDFVLVASTLLDLKAASLIPEAAPAELDDEDVADMTPDEMRDVLVSRLIAYRQFKSVASALYARQASEARMHPRTAGADPTFLSIMPDYLEGVDLATLGALCAGFFARRETFLLESEHIAAKRVPLEMRVEQVDACVRDRGRLTFDELVADDPSIENRVVSLLALLELNKRNSVRLVQPETFGTITIDAVAGAPAFVAELDHGELSIEGDVQGSLQSEAGDRPDVDEGPAYGESKGNVNVELEVEA